MFDAETRRHGDPSSRVALLRFIWAVWFAAHPVGWRTMMRWLILSFLSRSGCFDCSACFSRAALMRSSSLQALKKARSRRHWTCVIRPNMAARALGRGSALGRPGAARLGFEADTGLGVRRGFRQKSSRFSVVGYFVFHRFGNSSGFGPTKMRASHSFGPSSTSIDMCVS